MKVKIQIVIESDNYDTPITDEIACIQREDLTPETLGMTLSEAKDLLANIQAVMVREQAAEYVEQQRVCPRCDETRNQKDQHDIVFRSLFGKMKIPSPRLYTCPCQAQEKKSFSPLAECLPERTAPELLYILLISSVCPSSFDLPKLPFGLPSFLPLPLAAAKCL